MKKLITITLAVVLVLTLGTGLALAKGPTEKATGTVLDDNEWYADFNAHEGMEGGPAKGSMRTWNDVIGRDLYYDVKYVQVEGDKAWFAALCTGDSLGQLVGMWIFVKVQDNATPGSKGDKIGWDWESTNEGNAEGRVLTQEDPINERGVIGGNLVVHTLLPTISSDDLAGPFTVDVLEYFYVTTVNPPNGFAYEHVLFNYTIFGIALSNIVSFKYYDEGTTTWYDAPVSQDGSNVIGFFGPSTGFPMDRHYDETTKFGININTTGTYPVTITLNDLDDGNAVLATLTEDVVVNPTP